MTPDINLSRCYVRLLFYTSATVLNNLVVVNQAVHDDEEVLNREQKTNL